MQETRAPHHAFGGNSGDCADAYYCRAPLCHSAATRTTFCAHNVNFDRKDSTTVSTKTGK